MLVVAHITQYNKGVPIMIGTFMIDWLYKCKIIRTVNMPIVWATTFKAIRDDQVQVINAAKKIVNETRNMAGLAKKP